jgi:hypothetical protein
MVQHAVGRIPPFKYSERSTLPGVLWPAIFSIIFSCCDFSGGVFIIFKTEQNPSARPAFSHPDDAPGAAFGGCHAGTGTLPYRKYGGLSHILQ